MLGFGIKVGFVCVLLGDGVGSQGVDVVNVKAFLILHSCTLLSKKWNLFCDTNK